MNKNIMKQNAVATSSMRKIALSGMLLFTLAACSSGPPLFTPDGRPTTQVDCTGGNGWTECDRRAAVACGSGGYDLLAHDDSNNRRVAYIACRRPAQSY